MKFSPCLDIFFDDRPFGERIKAVSSLGYEQFEFWSWWDKDMDEIADLSQELKIGVAAYCTRFVSLVDPPRRSEYLEGLAESIENAWKTNTRILISQVGDELPGTARQDQLDTLAEGLKEAAGMLAGTDIVLAIEPLNTYYDHKGYFLSLSAEAVRVLKQVDSTNVKMLFDVYHQQIMEGDLVNNIRRYIDHIAHFHIADVPGRHEIGTGEINYPNVLAAIRESGYEGCIGLEFFPTARDHEEVLAKQII
ncbi:hydroxypyruvate isomerase family protein [Desulfopila sp. IMCC35008]|uniref:hydroxypyruvate isomerase family protein n=1 Tax=Desulfopila sp. IMCC35008 TaxID=2653858 RepID=UPI0013CF8692|nr:TIM barrel protein [Desulfopila sp. IMCC35008]